MEGDVAVLPELFNLLADQEDEQILSEIASFLCDLKENEAVPVLTEAIGNPLYASITTQLVSACWQNGLSYAAHIDTFVDVFVHGSLEAAIEAFTVIEEASVELEQDQRDRLVITLKSFAGEAGDQKKQLISELVKAVSSVHF